MGLNFVWLRHTHTYILSWKSFHNISWWFNSLNFMQWEANRQNGTHRFLVDNLLIRMSKVPPSHLRIRSVLLFISVGLFHLSKWTRYFSFEFTDLTVDSRVCTNLQILPTGSHFLTLFSPLWNLILGKWLKLYARNPKYLANEL